MRILSKHACHTGTLIVGLLVAGSPVLAAPRIELIELPPGFAISVYAENVPNAREMALGDGGTLFVGSRTAGNVYAVVDADGDGRADRTVLIDSGLTLPSGVAFHQGALYVGAVSRVLRYDRIEERLDDPPEPVVVTDALPTNTHHGWKFIDFGPDGKLYVPVGAPCNVCVRQAPYSSILRMNLDGSGMEVYARGVRNSVGFAWHPDTGELWFTDNGRDQLGDNIPPGELNRAPEPGLHFGFPHCHGRDVPDPRYASGTDCAQFTPPAQELGPHVAPLGMTFYDGAMFPRSYRNQVFIAEHGSWNRSQKIGYRVTLVRLGEDGLPASYDVFAQGWLHPWHPVQNYSL